MVMQGPNLSSEKIHEKGEITVENEWGYVSKLCKYQVKHVMHNVANNGKCRVKNVTRKGITQRRNSHINVLDDMFKERL